MSSNFLIKVLTYNLLNGQLYTVGAIFALLFSFVFKLYMFCLEIYWDTILLNPSCSKYDTKTSFICHVNTSNLHVLHMNTVNVIQIWTMVQLYNENTY